MRTYRDMRTAIDDDLLDVLTGRQVRNFRMMHAGGYRYYMKRGTLMIVVSLWAKDLTNRPYCARVLWRERERLRRMVARGR